MILHNFRFSPTPRSCLGNFYINQEWQCFMLEPEAEQRIPGGIYTVKLRTEGPAYEYWKKEMPEAKRGIPWITGVSNRSYILIHPGNWVHQSDGCLMPGTTCNNNLEAEGSVASSRKAFAKIILPIQNSITGGEDVKIVVGDIVELVKFNL